MSRLVGVVVVPLLLGAGCTRGIQPSAEMNAAFEEGRVAYLGTASGGLPVRGSAVVPDGQCIEIAPTACLVPVRDGPFCEREGGPSDIVLVDAEVASVICYPPAMTGDVVRVGTEGGGVVVPRTASGTAIVFEEETDGVPIEGDLVIEGNDVAIYGNGPEATRIVGDVIIDGNNVRLRGVTVEGDVRVSRNAAAIALSRIEGDLILAEPATNGSILAGNDVLGSVRVPSNEAVLVANRVGGPFLISGEDVVCADNLAFDDDGDGQVEDIEILGKLACEPGGARP